MRSRRGLFVLASRSPALCSRKRACLPACGVGPLRAGHSSRTSTRPVADWQRARPLKGSRRTKWPRVVRS
eukprot:9757177-Alexandrium_andersonii.AAC.1